MFYQSGGAASMEGVTLSHGVKNGHGGKVNIYNFRMLITITIDSRR